MRTTFSVALLMGLALAQPGWNPWGDDPVVPDPSPAPEEDTRPDECAADIVTIDGDIEDIEGDCDAKAAAASTLQAQLNLTQGDIENLVEQNRENSVGLAGLEQLDILLQTDANTGMLPDLGVRVNGLTTSIGASDDGTVAPDETIAKKLQRLFKTLEDIKGLMLRIDEAQAACEAIQETQVTNGEKLVEIEADDATPLSLAKALADFGTTLIRKDACETETMIGGTIDLAIEANEALNDTNQAAFDALKDDIESQVVTNDFWTRNAAAVPLDATSGTLDSFKVADGVPFEFWSYLNAEGENNGVLTSVALKGIDNAILAESEKNSMLVQQPPPDRAFPVVYKGVGNGECMTIDFTSVVSMQNANMDMNQHTWGVRTYNDDYINTDFSSAACPP